jgi:hypothetical protein
VREDGPFCLASCRRRESVIRLKGWIRRLGVEECHMARGRGVDLVELLPKVRVFRDRATAGARLAEQLGPRRARNALALGIPRGGVLVAAEVARRLDAELDVAVASSTGNENSPSVPAAQSSKGG